MNGPNRPSLVSLAAKWYERSLCDLRGARLFFDQTNPEDYENSCYHCQQAAEKALKGCLTLYDIPFLKKHDLDYLCQLCIGQEPSFATIHAECKELTVYSNAPRYPEYPEIDRPEAESALAKTEKIIVFCSKFLSTNK